MILNYAIYCMHTNTFLTQVKKSIVVHHLTTQVEQSTIETHKMHYSRLAERGA